MGRLKTKKYLIKKINKLKKIDQNLFLISR